MNKPQSLAILFADLAESTRLYETIGHHQAREATARCLQELAQVTKTHQGQVIKSMGHEIMCAFPTADDAAQAAVSMQASVGTPPHTGGVPLHLRIGFHFGEVVMAHNDLFGDAITLAARMATQAQAGQIITTGETLAVMRPNRRIHSRTLLTTHVKGKTAPVQICELTGGKEKGPDTGDPWEPSVGV